MPKSDGWFRPGTSGNPGGRPKNRGYINQHARAYASRAIFSLAQQCTGIGVPARDKRAAAKLLLRIGFGPGSLIGDGILRELGWERVRENLENYARADEREFGAASRRSLSIRVVKRNDQAGSGNDRSRNTG